MIKTALLLAVLLAFSPPQLEARRAPPCEAKGIPHQYDKVFQKAAKRHLPSALRNNWCILKSICWIESGLNPKAVSSVGAQGLCQVMPTTAADLKKRNLWRGRLRSAKANAEASALVYKNYWNIWAVPRTLECRNDLTLASYNAGPGNIIKAQVESGGALCWDKIKYGLPEVTGKHHRETWDYVDRWTRTYYKLRGYTLD